MNSDMEVLELGENSMKAGAAGLSFGRNVFQHANPVAITKALVNIVHDGVTANQALKALDASK